MDASPHTAKRLCIVTPEFPPDQWGGLARTAERVARHSADLGFSVHVAHFEVTCDRLVLLDENRETRDEDGITIHKIRVGRQTMEDGSRELWDCPHTMTLRMMYQSLETLHRDHRFDLFHALFLYPVGYVTGLIARRFDVPNVVTLAGNDIKKYVFSPEKVAVCRSGLENADIVIGLSRDLVEMAHSLTPVKEKARVIHNSVETSGEPFRSRLHGDGPFRIGCAGIFKYAKGLPYLIKAVSMLAESRELVLALRGVLRE
jgi:glycosyltransferase involved in cell wall biosynthesis